MLCYAMLCYAVVSLNYVHQPYVGHVLDLFKELEAENYTMRIAATRFPRIYWLEDSNPKFRTVFEGFCLRSEVDRGRRSI